MAKAKLLDRAKAAVKGPSQETAIAQAVVAMPSFLRQKEFVEILDKWMTGKQSEIEQTAGSYLDGQPYSPREPDDEYSDLSSRAFAPFGKLIVNSVSQTSYTDGARITGSAPDKKMDAWEVLEQNEWGSRQIAVHRAAIGHGVAFVKALPGISPIDDSKTAVVRGVSAKRMAVFYDDLDDEFPAYAIQCDLQPPMEGEDSVWAVQLFDEEYIHHLTCEGLGNEADDWTYISHERHSLGICPIVVFSNQPDLDGHSTGEIEPIIPLLRRLDQDTFDRLIVQRFGAWKIRYITGMAKPTNLTDERAQALALRLQDLLISEDPDSKFGTLDATEMEGFIKAHDADLRILSAVAQVPPHHLLGISSNLQAEALAAAEAGLQRKSNDFKTVVETSHERLLRIIAKIRGNREEAQAKNIEIRWRDTESRSLVQAADALTKLAQGLGIPVEMLWERIPDWSDDDTTRAKELLEDGGVDRLLAELEKMANETPPTEKVNTAQDRQDQPSTPSESNAQSTK